jgi:hypothetical protein
MQNLGDMAAFNQHSYAKALILDLNRTAVPVCDLGHT